jgi:hypothetical protein
MIIIVIQQKLTRAAIVPHRNAKGQIREPLLDISILVRAR